MLHAPPICSRASASNVDRSGLRSEVVSSGTDSAFSLMHYGDFKALNSKLLIKLTAVRKQHAHNQTKLNAALNYVAELELRNQELEQHFNKLFQKQESQGGPPPTMASTTSPDIPPVSTS